ncbi:MAG: phosphoribosylaminoimidazolesuccinocarboxamide synthase [Gemmatimonadetes bacterium]|nr:phosphoribosylaminoimidazolesuccinocarboxamide synthase [Gemmatimonadota bacterium]
MISLPLLFRGKVRDVYEVPGDRLLLVASDRVSAFDVVMAEPVPAKGRVLTQITAWWLGTHLDGVPHHVISLRPGEIAEAVPALAGSESGWAGRSTLVRRTRPLPVECVVRGYLSGSAWKEYRESGTLAGEPLPTGLAESDPLVPAIFSPATKATEGHDENITFEQMAGIVGADLAAELRRRSLDIYERGRAAAAECGIILADTKFEFGIAPDGRLIIIDEVLTPDSSRFWPREHYRRGRPQPSLDKQPLRDHLDGLADWNKQYPPPPLPQRVIAAAAERYREVFRRLTGTELEEYEAPRFGGSGR